MAKTPMGPRNQDPDYHRKEPTAQELFAGTEADFHFEHFEYKQKLSGRGTDKYKNPAKEFTQLGLDEVLIGNIRKCKYKLLTPAQQISLPILLDGRDMVLAAQTGSGKTAAFLLPMLQDMIAKWAPTEANTPYGLILAPTRELSIQIYDEARKFAANTGYNVRIAYGGVRRGEQARKIREGCDVLVATPGRLLDFLQDGVVDFNYCQFVVLDEADELLEVGFKAQLDDILEFLPSTENRITAMFSATITEKVQELGNMYLHKGSPSKMEYIFARVAPCVKVPTGIVQELRHPRDCLKEVQSILQGRREQRVLVFVKTKDMAREWEQTLSSFKAAAIHGDKSQQEREVALEKFKNGRIFVLVATDVASRGLDIPHVEVVIQVGLPSNTSTYIHRIGRTGRRGLDGLAVTLFDGGSAHMLPEIAEVLRENDQQVPDWVDSIAKRPPPRSRSAGPRSGPPGRGRGGGGRGGGGRGGGGRGGGGRSGPPGRPAIRSRSSPRY